VNFQELLLVLQSCASRIELPDMSKSWLGFTTVSMLTAGFCLLVMKLQASSIAHALPYVLQQLK
jgi:branched-subunit amino acid transport protein